MRTEVKIGIVVGLVVAISFVVYFAVIRPMGQKKQDQAQQPAPPAGRTPANVITQNPNIPRPEATGVNGAAVPSAALPAGAVPTNVTPSAGTTVNMPPVPSATSGQPGTGVAAAPAGAAPGSTGRAPGVTSSDRVGMQNDLYGRPVSPLPYTTGVPTAPVRPTTGGMREYVVKPGDTGSEIAIAEYGHAKHFKLIDQANPGVNWTNLKPGSVLKLPPLPAGTTTGSSIATGTPTTLPATAGGSVRTAATRSPLTPGPGQKVYKVLASDSKGYWGIAEKEYGSGSYHLAIAKANPGIDSSRLRPGQELLLPAKADLDATISAARSGATGSNHTATASAGAAARTPSTSGGRVFD